MKFIEKVFICLSLIGLLGSSFSKEYAAMILAIAIVGMALLYLLAGFKIYNTAPLPSSDGRDNVAVARADYLIGFIAALTHVAMLIGIIFRVQHWPFGNWLFYGGTGASLVMAFIVYYPVRSTDSILLKNIAARTIAIFMTGMQVAMIM